MPEKHVFSGPRRVLPRLFRPLKSVQNELKVTEFTEFTEFTDFRNSKFSYFQSHLRCVEIDGFLQEITPRNGNNQRSLRSPLLPTLAAPRVLLRACTLRMLFPKKLISRLSAVILTHLKTKNNGEYAITGCFTVQACISSILYYNFLFANF